MKKSKPSTSFRLNKIQSFLTQELGDIIKPLLENQKGLVTISKIEVTKDLKQSVVWVSIFNGEDDKILQILNTHTRQINRELFKIMPTKIVPNLFFTLDTSPRYAQHIDERIREIHSEN